MLVALLTVPTYCTTYLRRCSWRDWRGVGGITQAGGRTTRAKTNKTTRTEVELAWAFLQMPVQTNSSRPEHKRRRRKPEKGSCRM